MLVCSQVGAVEHQRESSDSCADTPLYGSSPVTPLVQSTLESLRHIKAKVPESLAPEMMTSTSTLPAARAPDLLSVSIQTIVGSSELLGHSLEARDTIREQQDAALVHALQAVSTTPLRDSAQKPLFIVAPLDVLVTRDKGVNKFHIIEINGTGIAGITNMTNSVIQTMMTSISELPQQLQHIQDAVVLVASSGQESFPPVSRTMHEKMLYIEALKKGYEALGKTCHVTNMTRLEQRPDSMPPSGVTLVLGKLLSVCYA